MNIAKAIPRYSPLFLLISLPPAAVLRIILKYGSNIPWMDQWSIPGRILVSHLRGTLALSDFFQTHNESVKAFSGLIWFLMARTGWHPRAEMIVSWSVTVALAAILYLILSRTVTTSATVRLSILTFMILFLFNPHGIQHWLTGLSLETTLVIFFLCAGLLVNHGSASTWLKYLLAACFSSAAIFSYANGMLLWLLICPALPLLVSPSGRTELRSTHKAPGLFYLVAGLASLICYFSVVAASPYKSAQPSWTFDKPLETLIFLLRWLGAPFSFPDAHWSGSLIGTLILIMFLSPLPLLINRNRPGETITASFPWLMLALYSLITGLLVTLGRQNISLEMTATAPRYFIHSVLLPIATLPITFQVLRGLPHPAWPSRLARTVHLSLASLMILLCTAAVLLRWTEADATAQDTAIKRARGAVALSFIKFIPRNPELEFINPFTDFLKSQARILTRHGIVDLPLYQPFPDGPDRPVDQPIDGLMLRLKELGSIVVTGRFPHSHVGGEISHLLLTSIQDDRPEKAFAVIRPDILKHSQQVEIDSGKATQFRTHVSTIYLETGLHRIKAWIFDDSSEVYTPLVNEWQMHHDEHGLFFFPKPNPQIANWEAEKQLFTQAHHQILRLESADLLEQSTLRKGINLENRLLHVSGRDPNLLLPTISCTHDASAAIHLSLQASHATFVQLFYKNDTNNNFTEQGSIWARVREGENDLYMTVPGPGINDQFRLDLGNRDGVFKLLLMEVRQ